MNEIEFLKEFSSEKKCMLFFKSMLEYKGVKCECCGCKKLQWGAKEEVWRCPKCTRKISIKSICFMKNSKNTYMEWLFTIYFLLESKKPISTKELQRKLGCNHYKRVYYMAMKIRYEVVRINRELEFSNYSLLKRIDRKDVQDGKLHSIPPRTKLFYKKDKRSFKLRMVISTQDFHGNLKELERKRKKYSFNKLLIFQNKKWVNYTVNPKNRRSCAINNRMDLLIQHNTNRVIEGIHHGVSRFHLQAYLDEFSFKYNNRIGGCSNFMLFYENIDIGKHRHT